MPVTVHVDEVHSEVAPLPSAPGEHTSAHTEPPWVADERWCEERDRMVWLARRVCAVDFDD